MVDSRRRATRQATADAIVDAFDIVRFDLETARHHAVLLAHARRSGRPRGAHDLQIAATARATGRTLLTTDRTAFDDLPDVRHRMAVVERRSNDSGR
jgi:tRNA(fMet)-specific endonuclease VapC